MTCVAVVIEAIHICTTLIIISEEKNIKIKLLDLAN